jgi:hypothetical protein
MSNRKKSSVTCKEEVREKMMGHRRVKEYHQGILNKD